ncbi:hypothetical protein SprV_0100175600 [Sparganum proliferum]
MATVNTTPSTPIIGENIPDALPPTPALTITNADSILTRTHCDLTSTSRTGLVGHLRFPSTETGESGPEELMHTHRTRLNCHTAHDHQVTDGGIIFVKPVLVLATGAAEDSQDDRMNGVPQLEPSTLYGGVFIWSWQVFQPLAWLIAEMQTVGRQSQQSSFQLTWRLLTLWPPAGLQTELHFGNDKAVIRSAVGLADCLGPPTGPVNLAAER